MITTSFFFFYQNQAQSKVNKEIEKMVIILSRKVKKWNKTLSKGYVVIWDLTYFDIDPNMVVKRENESKLLEDYSGWSNKGKSGKWLIYVIEREREY